MKYWQNPAITKIIYSLVFLVENSKYQHYKSKHKKIHQFLMGRQGYKITFLIMGLFVGTIVTLSLYMLSNSELSVAAVPVIPQSFGNYISHKIEKSEILNTVREK